ncbi:hypothetical protein DAETH_47640 (plasmid) [Deinococcus aetherius]|uniref:Molecular chaperone DnaJ n=1 Tax=Deinococcus aetherius TaxID=200252 RepID=A0ABN6RNB5_9DEIO|nr:hypothetical protein [Deinococcus aetherius]BDP44795.1 hypothetical protein DAETH_47640 [Deinococcus aetherius]
MTSDRALQVGEVPCRAFPFCVAREDPRLQGGEAGMALLHFLLRRFGHRVPDPVLVTCPNCHGEGDLLVDDSIVFSDPDTGAAEVEVGQNLETCTTCQGSGRITLRTQLVIRTAHLVNTDRWWARHAKA